MSLLAWYPLIDNMYNQGLGDFDLNIITAPTFGPGLLKNSLINGGASTWTAEQTSKILNNNALSICFWVYIDAESGSTTKREMFFGNNGGTGNINRRFSIFNYPNCNAIHVSGWNGTATFNTLDENVLPSYKWTHVAVCYKLGEIKIYINGNCINTYTNIIVNNDSYEYTTNVIYSCQYRKVNDYRFYDHCLSAKEVKEISRGLFVHYPLNNQYEQSILNKYSGTTAEGSGSGNFTKTKLPNERGYNYTLKYTSTGANYWPCMGFGTFSFTVGKTYYYSAKVRCNKWNSGYLNLRACRSTNDWVTNMVTVCSPGRADGKWHEYYVYQTINETYVRNGETITCNPVLEFWCGSLNETGVVYDFDFDIKDVQVIESDVPVPFIDNTFNTAMIADISGYKNNGVLMGTATYNSTTPKYNGCMDFVAGSGIFTNLNIQLEQFTISFWEKHTKIGTMLFGSNVSQSSMNTNWYQFGDNSIKIPNCEYYYLHNAGTDQDMLNKWMHFVAIYDGSNIYVYRNGIYEGSKACTGSKLLEYLSIGIGYNKSSFWEDGSISDFRLYTTALSEDDVKELYNTSASIANNGAIFCNEFIEE